MAEALACQIVSWPDFVHVLEDCPLVVIPAGVHQTPDIPLSLVPAQRQKGLDFGCDEQSTLLHSPKEWLDSIAIPHSNEKLPLLIKEYACKLAPQMMNKVESVI